MEAKPETPCGTAEACLFRVTQEGQNLRPLVRPLYNPQSPYNLSPTLNEPKVAMKPVSLKVENHNK